MIDDTLPDNWAELISYDDILAKLADESHELQHDVYNLLWVIASREYGVHEALSSLESVYQYMNERAERRGSNTDSTYAISLAKARKYTENLTDLYLLENLINLLGMNAHMDHIMSLEIENRFGRRDSTTNQSQVRLDRRSLMELAHTIGTVKLDETDKRFVLSTVKTLLQEVSNAGTKNAKKTKQRKAEQRPDQSR